MKASLACVHPDYKCEVQQTMAARLVELRIQCQYYRNTSKTKNREKTEFVMHFVFWET